MRTRLNAEERVRFGRFELDVRTGELTPLEAVVGEDQRQKTLLREQPFQILRMLIDREGKIVSRSEIKARLWPGDTVVDFDRSINVAMAILRRELNDSADNPKYVETLARRGYRLLVPVEWQQSSIEPRGPGVEVRRGRLRHLRRLKLTASLERRSPGIVFLKS